ncbi:hypothetical protein Ocin01_15323 [Orchesella cincta]|uniref:DUF427 domain-containing protein n=1 Tax=Orchesella cincta TaxID=48709 RepID=A0A1D2MED1_ORCCI|nr:hypothetical protein Ocin01_15323 [Orchesella cincta]
MPTAKWNGAVLADSNDTVEVETNKYFPNSSLKMEYFKECDKTTVCPWKGTAKYYDIVVNGKTNQAAAWYYPDPKPEAAQIKGRVAFWKGVEVR